MRDEAACITAVHVEFDEPPAADVKFSMRWHRFLGGHISWREGAWRCSCGKKWPAGEVK